MCAHHHFSFHCITEGEAEAESEAEAEAEGAARVIVCGVCGTDIATRGTTEHKKQKRDGGQEKD